MTSYRDLDPIERGGEVARHGLGFQDHVAAKYCIEMLTSSRLVEVWCETLDDITLVWAIDDREMFEFVQVKSDELDQLWSIALLCKRPPGKTGRSRGGSIAQKSLAHDRGEEPCSFRVVTALGFKKELQKLTFATGMPGRANSDDCAALAAAFEKSLRLGKRQLLSPNGNGLAHWVEHLVLEDAGSLDSLAAKNKLALQTACVGLQIDCSRPELDRLYERLVWRLNEAGRAQWLVDPEQKKLRRAELVAFLHDEREASCESTTAGAKLRTKMAAAKVPGGDIEAALNLRRRYRSRALESGYVGGGEHDLEDAALVALHRLRARLVGNPAEAEGVRFLERCCNELREIATRHGQTDPALEAYLVGYMYDVTDRCAHSFTR